MNDAPPSGEVPERVRRRTFTAAYKLKVLAEYEAAEPGRRGEVLRREGLYSSHLVEWRRAGTPARWPVWRRLAVVRRPTRSNGTTPGSRPTWTPRGG